MRFDDLALQSNAKYCILISEVLMRFMTKDGVIHEVKKQGSRAYFEDSRELTDGEMERFNRHAKSNAEKETPSAVRRMVTIVDPVDGDELFDVRYEAEPDGSELYWVESTHDVKSWEQMGIVPSFVRDQIFADLKYRSENA